MELNVGNIIPLLSVLIAVASFCYTTSKRILLYKFNVWNILVLVSCFLLINYLIYFPVFEAHGIYFHCLMSDKAWLTAEQWAYPATLLFVAFLLMVLFKAPFSKKKYDKIINLYNSLITENPSELVSYLVEHHIKNIQDYIVKTNQLIRAEKETDPIFEYDDGRKRINILKKKSRRGANLEAMILTHIVFNKRFIDASYEISPLLFLKIVSVIDNNRYSGFEDASKYYFSNLLAKRNPFLVDGITNTNNFGGWCHEHEVSYRLSDSEFAELLYGNLDFTVQSYSWFSFGEAARQDIKRNSSYYLSKNSQLDEINQNENLVLICLRYYDILIRALLEEKINEKTESHYHYYIYPYYWTIIQDLASLCAKDKNTNAELLINDALSKIEDWIICCIYTNNYGYGNNIIDQYESMVITYLHGKVSEELMVTFERKLIRWIFTISDEEIRFCSRSNGDVKQQELSQHLKSIIEKENRVHPRSMKQAWEKEIDPPADMNKCYFNDLKSIINT